MRASSGSVFGKNNRRYSAAKLIKEHNNSIEPNRASFSSLNGIKSHKRINSSEMI